MDVSCFATKLFICGLFVINRSHGVIGVHCKISLKLDFCDRSTNMPKMQQNVKMIKYIAYFATAWRSLPNVIKSENLPYFWNFCYPCPCKISSKFDFCDRSANMPEMRQNVKMIKYFRILRQHSGHCQIWSNLKICHIFFFFATYPKCENNQLFTDFAIAWRLPNLKIGPFFSFFLEKYLGMAEMWQNVKIINYLRILQ